MEILLTSVCPGPDGESVSQQQKVTFKRLVMTVCMAVWNMVSIAQQMAVRQQLLGFLPGIEQLETTDDVEVSAAEFLSIAHAMVDDTECKMFEALELHYAHHKERKLAAGRTRHRAEEK